MTTKQISKARTRIKRHSAGFISECIAVYWLRIILFAILLSGIIHSCAHASMRPRGTPVPRQMVVYYHHDNHIDPVPYIVTGIIAGVVIYAVFNKRCEHGLICKRF